MKKKSSRKSKRPTIGLALSGGSVRGLAYIGFLKVMEEEKIPIDFVAGTSIGAIIGAMYCSGLHAKEMEEIVSKMDWESFMDFTSEYTGLLDGKKIERFLRKSIKVSDFKDLYIPLAVTTVDINAGEEIIFEQGDLIQAVRASMSIPGVFTPVESGNRLLVDGGVLDPIPTDALEGKVDKIIAIDLSIPFEVYKNAKAMDSKNMTWNIFKMKFLVQEFNNISEYFRTKPLKFFPRILIRGLLKIFNPKYLMRFLQGKTMKLPPLFQVAMKSNHLVSNELIRLKLKLHKPDLLIPLTIKDARFIEFDKYQFLIKKGEEVARKHLKEIKKLAKIP